MLLHNTDIVSYCATAIRYTSIELKKRNILMKNKLKLSISI